MNPQIQAFLALADEDQARAGQLAALSAGAPMNVARRLVRVATALRERAHDLRAVASSLTRAEDRGEEIRLVLEGLDVHETAEAGRELLDRAARCAELAARNVEASQERHERNAERIALRELKR